MSLINSSIRSFVGLNGSLRSFAGQRSSMAKMRKSRPIVFQMGNNEDDNGANNQNSGTIGFGGNDSSADSVNSPNTNDGARPGVGAAGWWLCTSSDFGLSPISWLHIENADIRKPRRIIKHPVESGSVVIDNIADDPWTADVRGMVEDVHYNGHSGFSSGEKNPVEEVEKELKEAYKNRDMTAYLGFKFGKNGGVIANKNGRPVNFQIAEYGSRINRDKIGIYDYHIRLQEVMIAEAKNYFMTYSPEHSDTSTK